MKALKIILAILLFIAIPICMLSACGYKNCVDDFQDGIYDNWPYDQSLESFYPTLSHVEISIKVLIFATLILFVSAGVLALAMQNKYYTGFISGGLVALCVSWFAICYFIVVRIGSMEMIELMLYLIPDYCLKAIRTTNIALYFYTAAIPMFGFLTIGIIETINHKRKTSCVSLPEAFEQIEANPINAEVAPIDNNIDQIKAFKKLMDDGIITQEEFDTKKKQLLGL